MKEQLESLNSVAINFGAEEVMIVNIILAFVMFGVALFLCSDKAGFIMGENTCIDGGMTRQMIYHGDHGWKLEK